MCVLRVHFLQRQEHRLGGYTCPDELQPHPLVAWGTTRAAICAPMASLNGAIRLGRLVSQWMQVGRISLAGRLEGAGRVYQIQKFELPPLISRLVFPLSAAAAFTPTASLSDYTIPPLNNSTKTPFPCPRPLPKGHHPTPPNHSTPTILPPAPRSPHSSHVYG